MARREISERCYNRDQSWNYEWTGQIGKQKFRVRIRRNAHHEQSYARVFIWDPVSLKWNSVVDSPIGECDCGFHTDRDRLLREATDITAEPQSELEDAARNLLTALDDPEFQVLRWGPVEASVSRLEAFFEDKPELEEIVPIEDDGRPPKHHQV